MDVDVVVHEVGADVVPCDVSSSSVYKQLQKFSTLHHQSVVLLLCVISSIQYLQSFDPKYKCKRMISASAEDVELYCH